MREMPRTSSRAVITAKGRSRQRNWALNLADVLLRTSPVADAKNVELQCVGLRCHTSTEIHLILPKATGYSDSWSIQPRIRQRSATQVAMRHLARSVFLAVSAMHRLLLSDWLRLAHFPRSLLGLNKLRSNSVRS